MNLNKTFTILIALLLVQQMYSQVESNSDLYQTIKNYDSILFEDGFNKCVLKDIEIYISEDLEFYHDQGGLSTSRKTFMESMEQNICSNWKQKPIRKLVENSMQVFPLYNDGVLYGAIQKGIHEFYIKEKNKNMYLTSTAKFTHVWIKNKNGWKLKRVLSYDHQQPKSKINDQLIVKISKKTLENYSGEYEAPQSGKVMVSIVGDELKIVVGEMVLKLLPKSETIFFNKEAPLTFEFIKGDDGSINKLIIRERNEIVEEAKKVK